jgi:cytidine deaminase
VAIFSAVAAGCKQISAIAICCPDAADGPISLRMPCGACRQVMAEFGKNDLRVLIDGGGEFQLAELLKHAYKLSVTADNT